MDGGEEDAAVGWGAGFEEGGEGRGVGDWEVGAGEDAEFDGAGGEEGEADGVLAAAEEALGAVDGVEGPDSAVRSAGAVALVDGVEHLLFAFDGAAELAFRGCIF